MNIKHVKVEYIEKGCFQGGDEDTSKAGIKYGGECIVISKKTFKKIKEQLFRLEQLEK